MGDIPETDVYRDAARAYHQARADLGQVHPEWVSALAEVHDPPLCAAVESAYRAGARHLAERLRRAINVQVAAGAPPPASPGAALHASDLCGWFLAILDEAASDG